jgi:uncharacterized protein (DUF305 family)
MSTWFKPLLAGAAGLILAAPALAQPQGRHMAGAEDASAHMHRMMESGHQKSMQMQLSGDPDRDFARMMRSHHEAGIAMAQVEVDQGKDAAMKKLAQKIIDGQKQEIKQLDDWMAKHSRKAAPAP